MPDRNSTLADHAVVHSEAPRNAGGLNRKGNPCLVARTAVQCTDVENVPWTLKQIMKHTTIICTACL